MRVLQIGDKIKDCYMFGRDYVIVRDLELDEPIYVHGTVKEYLKKHKGISIEDFEDEDDHIIEYKL